jgi:serine/threonine protein kinase/Tol biopolymer transport system component
MHVEPGTRIGPYEITAQLGSGGMGEVWKARDTRLERSVAIKMLPAEFANDSQLRLRFEREAKTISQLEHPHICRLYDVGEAHAGEAYLVLELLEGESLADRLGRGPLPMSDVLRFGAQIADALDRAHRAGIVHRDLKPGNVVLTRSGAKLLDFGLAREASWLAVADGATVQKPLTQEGMIVGTFQYMAPEQIEGGQADARTDIFALGSVLYEMATGRRAFEGKTKASLIAAIVDRDPLPLSELQPLTPRQFERVVNTCLNKNPDERWQSAGDLRRELEWIRDASSTRETPATPPQRRRRRMVNIAAMTLLPVGAAIAAFVAARATAPSPPRLVSSIAPPKDCRFIVTGDAAGPVTLSPDGRMAAFVAHDGKDVDLWVQSLETGVNTQLSGTANAMFPFWSPDSRSVAFFANGRLLVVDVDGSAPRVLAEAPDARGGTWTPDGQIIFTPITQTGLYRLPAAGGPATPLTTPVPPHSTHRWPAVLPDGKHIVFFAASHGEPTSSANAVMIVTVDGKDVRKVVAAAANAIPYRDSLIYPRGERLIMQRLEKGVLSGAPTVVWDRALNDPGTWRTIASVSDTGLMTTYPAAPLGGMRLVSIDPATKESVELAPRNIYRDLSLSPDGEKLAVTIGDPNSVLYLEDLRRQVRTRFSFIDQTGFPAWSPDGKFLAFNSSKGSGNFEVVVKPVDGSAPERTIARASYPMQPSCVDGRGVVLFNSLDASSLDVQGVSVSGGKPFTVVGGPGQQTNGMVSPDGRWLTYVEVGSNGRAAFVTTYPTPGPKWQVAEDTTYWLWWSGDGKQLLYLTGNGDIKTVDVTFIGNSVQFSAPRMILNVRLNTNRRGLTMSADGRRIIASSVIDDDPGAAMLVTNFDAGLR